MSSPIPSDEFDDDHDSDDDDDYSGSGAWCRYDRDSDDMDESVDSHPKETKEEKHRREQCIKIMDDLNKDRHMGDLCDVVIQVEDQEFPVHRLILKATCPYFYAMFSGSFDEREKKCIEIKGVSKDAFKYILNYLYGEVGLLTDANILDVYHCADMLCIDNVVKECKTYHECNWHSMKDKNAAYRIAKSMDLMFTMKSIINNLHCLFTTVIKESYFPEMLYEVLLEVLKKGVEYPQMIETTVEAIIVWVMHDPDGRFSKVDELISQVPLDQVPNITIEKLVSALGTIPLNDTAMEKEMDALFEKIKSSTMVTRQRLCNLQLKLVSFSNRFSEVEMREFHYRTFNWTKHRGNIGLGDCLYMNPIYRIKAIQTVQLLKDHVYIFGSQTVLAYNLVTQSTTALASLPCERQNFCVLGYENTMIVLGGHRQVLRYDLVLKTWQKMFLLYPSRCSVLDAVHYNGNFYMLCGPPIGKPSESCKYLMSYDLSSKHFVRLTKLKRPVKNPRIMFLDNHLFVFGEHIPANSRSTFLQPLERQLCQIYNIEKKTWSDSRAKISLSDAILDVTTVAEGIVVVLMNRGRDDTEITVSLYTHKHDTLEPVASLPRERNLPYCRRFHVEANGTLNSQLS